MVVQVDLFCAIQAAIHAPRRLWLSVHGRRLCERCERGVGTQARDVNRGMHADGAS